MKNKPLNHQMLQVPFFILDLIARLKPFLRCLLLLMGISLAGLATALATAADSHAGSKDDAVVPEFTLMTDEGERTIASLRGQVVYVDFWASWCGPCRYSFPWMNEMHEKYAEAGLTVVGVSLDRYREDADRFLDEVPADFTIAYDPEGALVKVFGVRGMPSAYIINRKGEIVASHVGFNQSDEAQYEQSLLDVLNDD